MSDATVSSKGQVTIPVDVRVAAGITAGSKLTFTRLPNGKIVLRVKSGTLADLRGIAKTTRRVLTEKLGFPR